MPIDPAASTMTLLSEFGPASERPTPSTPRPVSPEEALAYVRGLASTHYENFTVLSRLVPQHLRDDFAAVYAFCRWSDDLADETGNTDEARARSLRLLAWWRAELDACFTLGGTSPPPAHPVYIALRRIVEKHSAIGALTSHPFHHLLDAFVQDQHTRRYRTWEEVISYCSRSADPVGRIVLALGGYADSPANAERYRLSDCTCTALQLINFWQDVRRDLLERDRVYIPAEDMGISVEMLREWADRPNDPAARVPYIQAVRPLVEKTSALFDEGRPLPRMLRRDIAPVVWLLGAGGRTVLRSVERTGCVTLWERPTLSKPAAAGLVARAWVMARLGLIGERG